MEVHELDVSVRKSDGSAVIDLKGELNSSAERSLDAGYAEAVASGASSIALNFTSTDYINSTGIALIVGLLGQARSKGDRGSCLRSFRPLPRDLRDHPPGRLHANREYRAERRQRRGGRGAMTESATGFEVRELAAGIFAIDLAGT